MNIRMAKKEHTNAETDETQRGDVPPISALMYRNGDVVAGKYRLLDCLGIGGMGEVWCAQSMSLDTRVAIKLVRAGAHNQRRKARLLREARVAARVAGPGIVRIYDSGETSRGHPYIVMELLLGVDMARYLETVETLAPLQAASLVLPVARAVARIHAAGIVHRDLKPENVFLVDVGRGYLQPKLLDFGIAKQEAPQASRLTEEGAVLGSPEYMSPEQARGDEVDGRADIWAIGLILYVLIRGKSPFKAKNAHALLHAIQYEAIEPFECSDDRRGTLWAIVERCMRKDPAERFQDARQIGEQLESFLLSSGIKVDATGFGITTTGERPAEDSVELPPIPARRAESPADDVRSMADSRDATTTVISFHREPVVPAPVAARGRLAWAALLASLLVLGVLGGWVAWTLLEGRHLAPAPATGMPRRPVGEARGDRPMQEGKPPSVGAEAAGERSLDARNGGLKASVRNSVPSPASDSEEHAAPVGEDGPDTREQPPGRGALREEPGDAPPAAARPAARRRPTPGMRSAEPKPELERFKDPFE